MNALAVLAVVGIYEQTLDLVEAAQDGENPPPPPDD